MLNDQHRAKAESEISHAACMLFGGVASVIEADELLVGSLKHWFAFLLDMKHEAETACCPFIVPGQEFEAHDPFANEVMVVSTGYVAEDPLMLRIIEVGTKRQRLCDWNPTKGRWELYDV